ncbi:MAG: quinone-dependent dihydroorotate dehydrogenase [Chloroflexi bacterium]|nr:quinone-dependent dihydroorotate dehydrogenase [Chloroflexota bacterium]
MAIYPVLRSLLFRLDPEDAHHLALALLRVAASTPPSRAWLRRQFDLAGRDQQVECCGLTFRNPLGLAAGYDKDGRAVAALALLGFGHIEVGTVTPQAQPGNPRPRIVRLPADRAVINRMGFPNRGAQALRARLARMPRERDFVLGLNLGKGRDTPLEHAHEDYCALVGDLGEAADYLAVNISSPNTQGLRQLQSRTYLDQLLPAVLGERDRVARRRGRSLPVLVKLAPDLTWPELDEILDRLLAHGVEGVIAINTTLARPGLHSPRAGEAGGLSGAPLRERAREVVAYIHAHTEAQLPIIGVGGIMGADDARRMLEAGALLIQVYTGLVYSGPGLAREILTALRRREAR